MKRVITLMKRSSIMMRLKGKMKKVTIRLRNLKVLVLLKREVLLKQSLIKLSSLATTRLLPKKK